MVQIKYDIYSGIWSRVIRLLYCIFYQQVSKYSQLNGIGECEGYVVSHIDSKKGDVDHIENYVHPLVKKS